MRDFLQSLAKWLWQRHLACPIRLPARPGADTQAVTASRFGSLRLSLRMPHRWQSLALHAVAATLAFPDVRRTSRPRVRRTSSPSTKGCPRPTGSPSYGHNSTLILRFDDARSYGTSPSKFDIPCSVFFCSCGSDGEFTPASRTSTARRCPSPPC